MALEYHPGLLPQAGQTVSVADPNDAQTPNKLARIPAFVLSDGVSGNGVLGSSGNPLVISSGSSPAASAGIVPTTGLNVTSLVVKASPGNLYSASMTAGAVAGYFIAYNAVTAPAGAAALTPALILNSVPVTANGYANLGGNPVPDRHTVGIVLLFSTSLATYTIPGTAAQFMRGSAV